MTKHGLEFSSIFWSDDGLASFSDDVAVEFYFGTRDKYVDHNMIKGMINDERLHFIEGAGHNFSESDSSNVLIQQIVQDILRYSWQSNCHKGDGN